MSEDDSRVASALCPRVHGWPTRAGLQNCGNMASSIMSGGSSSLFSGLNDKDAQRTEMDGASARPGLGLCPTRLRPCWTAPLRGRPLLPPPHSTPWRFARLGPKVSAVASPSRVLSWGAGVAGFSCSSGAWTLPAAGDPARISPAPPAKASLSRPPTLGASPPPCACPQVSATPDLVRKPVARWLDV